jgi:hypothetical protein
MMITPAVVAIAARPVFVDQAEQRRRERGVLRTRATEDAAPRRIDGPLALLGG